MRTVTLPRLLSPLVVVLAAGPASGCELGADSADGRAQDACRAVIEAEYPDHEIDDLTSRDVRDGTVEVYADLTSADGDLDLQCDAHREDGDWVADAGDLTER